MGRARAKPILERIRSPGGGYWSPTQRYFGAVRIVSFGSSRILRVPAGAGRGNEDSSPSANTRPSNTGFFPASRAYTGTDVTRFPGASFCRMVPLTRVPDSFGVNFTAFNSSLGKAVPFTHPTRNQSSDVFPS